jgi:hypothetical protein
VVREKNIYRWAGNLIGELCAVRTEAEPPLLRATAQPIVPRHGALPEAYPAEVLRDGGEKSRQAWVGGGAA